MERLSYSQLIEFFLLKCRKLCSNGLTCGICRQCFSCFRGITNDINEPFCGGGFFPIRVHACRRRPRGFPRRGSSGARTPRIFQDRPRRSRARARIFPYSQAQSRGLRVYFCCFLRCSCVSFPGQSASYAEIRHRRQSCI